VLPALGCHDSDVRKFFHHLRLQLAGTVEAGFVTPVNVLIGSDDERALRTALYMVFTNAPHPLCIQHLKQNVEHYLTDKVGQSSQVRRSIAAEIFETLTNEQDEEAFDKLAEHLLAKYR